MRNAYLILAGAVLGLAFNLNAQTATVGGFTSGGTTLQSTAPDSIVQVTAENQGLSLIAREDLPLTGTFWLITSNGFSLPMPCAPLDQSIPIYALSDNVFLADGTGGLAAVNRHRAGYGTVDDVLAAQANAVVALVNQTEAAQMRPMMRTMSMDFPFPGGGSGSLGSFTNDAMYYTWDTNQLWLEITNVTPDTTFANLHNGTNQVYAIWSTTDLATPLNQWQVATELWPTDTNCQPFTVQSFAAQNLYLRAEDWSGIDSDGDGIPDWWAWEYWGTANLMDTNLDYSGNGNTFAQDYSNNVTPTVFGFTGLAVTNNCINTSSANLQLNMTGRPYYIAVSVDDINFQTDAFWQTYSGSTNMAVNLGMTEGWHDVWIALRGHADDPMSAMWQHKRLKLDWTPPALFITNPINSTVDIPLIQLQGFSPEALSSISYDLTNAAGLLTGQQVLVLNQYYDTTTFEFTTNTFQAYDVVLTNGVNTFTFHATDLAGNTTTSSYSVTLDYSAKTNPPSVQVGWPQNGTQVSGNSFTLNGQVADATITVTATTTSSNGPPSTVNGLVERTGKFWLENLPLNSGTNIVTLTATDVAGNVTTTNLNVIQSTVTLTVNPVGNPPGNPQQLWQPTVNLTGGISDTTYAVWVNGVKGNNNGNGTWSASNVPVNSGGTATFTAIGYAPSEQQPDGSYGN